MGFERTDFNDGSGTSILSVTTQYGPRTTNQKFGGGPTTKGMTKELVYLFDYDQLPATSTSAMEQVLPAYAKIVSAKFEVLVGFTSTSTTTDLLVGLYKAADGVVVDADGLLTAANLTQTTIATRGLLTAGTGALVGASIGADASEVVVAPNVDDLLTGKARLIIEYIIEGPGGA